MPKQIIYIAIAALLLGVLPMPYGYYTLLRLIACGVFAWAAYVSYERKEPLLPWVFGILAITFNPIIKIYFPKEIWSGIDLAAGLLLLFTKNKIQDQA